MATFLAKSPTIVQAVGSYTEVVWGVDLTAGTSATITVPQLSLVLGVVCGNNTSATTLPYADTPSGNTFVITKGSGDAVTWIAFGLAHL